MKDRDKIPKLSSLHSQACTTCSYPITDVRLRNKQQTRHKTKGRHTGLTEREKNWVQGYFFCLIYNLSQHSDFPHTSSTLQNGGIGTVSSADVQLCLNTFQTSVGLLVALRAPYTVIERSLRFYSRITGSDRFRPAATGIWDVLLAGACIERLAPSNGVPR